MFDNTKKTTLKIILISMLCLLADGIAVEAALPRRDIKKGNLLYQKGDYAASKEKYKEALEKAPESDIVNFNLGTVLYKEQDYEQAVDHLQKVFLSEDENLKKNAHYNLGNALYRSGMTYEAEDVSRAVSALEKSLSQYERALEIDKNDEDAKHNYTYVQKELKRLKIKQKQQQQKKQQQQSQESKGQDQQSQQGREDQQQEQKRQKQEQGEEQQEQQGQGEESQDQEEKSDQERAQAGEEDYNEQQGSDAQPQNAQQLTQKEAQMLLESYQQTEEPQGLLNVQQRIKDARPVLKDW